MESLGEFARRRRIFRWGLRVTFLVEIGILVAGLTHILAPSVAGLALLSAAIVSLLALRWGLRWTQAVQPVVALSPDAAHAYDASRRQFVRRRGTYMFGLTWGATMAVASNWHALVSRPWPGRLVLLSFMLVLWLPAGAFTGWLWGRAMWRLFTPKVSSASNPPSGAA